MKQVILYKATTELVNVASDYVTLQKWGNPIKVTNSGEWVEGKVDVYLAPVRRFIWYEDGVCKNEIYAAFDEQLMDLMKIRVDELVREKHNGLLKELAKCDAEVQTLIAKNKALTEITVFEIIKLKFKRWFTK